MKEYLTIEDKLSILAEFSAKYENDSDFTTLDAWRCAREVKLFFYRRIIPVLPPEEKCIIISQCRRASRSAAANIAEGYGRFYYQEGIQAYRIARGSLCELKDDLISCLDLEYINEETFKEGLDLIEKAKKC